MNTILKLCDDPPKERIEYVHSLGIINNLDIPIHVRFSDSKLVTIEPTRLKDTIHEVIIVDTDNYDDKVSFAFSKSTNTENRIRDGPKEVKRYHKITKESLIKADGVYYDTHHNIIVDIGTYGVTPTVQEYITKHRINTDVFTRENALVGRYIKYNGTVSKIEMSHNDLMDSCIWARIPGGGYSEIRDALTYDAAGDAITNVPIINDIPMTSYLDYEIGCELLDRHRVVSDTYGKHVDIISAKTKSESEIIKTMNHKTREVISNSTNEAKGKLAVAGIVSSIVSVVGGVIKG